MGSIPDDEVSEQTNLRLLGRCADTALNSQRELEHTCGTYLKIESENGTVLKIHEFPTTFGTCFSLQAFFCRATVSNPMAQDQQVMCFTGVEAQRRETQQLSMDSYSGFVDLRLSFYGFEEKWAIPKTIGFRRP